jgi:hypothetical protein
MLNRVKPNVEKSVFIYVSSKFHSHHVRSSPLVVRDSTLPPVDECKHHGVTIDSHLSFSSHISNVCRSAYFHLYRIGKIRCFLDASTAHRLVHDFVPSRLDYCNSTFSRLPFAPLDHLQMVLNSAASLILPVRRREHVTRHLQYLNWLPIRRRIDFNFFSPPPPLLKLLCSTLPFLHTSGLYSPSECPGCYAPIF